MVGILITIYAGLEHAFEADHLVAVNSLVSEKTRIKDALKDGLFWGIGHTATLLLVGLIMIGLKIGVSKNIFSYFEACVGLMLIFLGIFRITKTIKYNSHSHTYWHKHDGLKIHPHTYTHKHWHQTYGHTHDASISQSGNYKKALFVGMVHGLAGSGALVVLVLAQMKTPFEGLLYILIFGIGSILGMYIASGLFGIPYSKKFLNSPKLQFSLTIISSFLCIFYGLKVVFDNII